MQVFCYFLNCAYNLVFNEINEYSYISFSIFVWYIEKSRQSSDASNRIFEAKVSIDLLILRGLAFRIPRAGATHGDTSKCNVYYIFTAIYACSCFHNIVNHKCTHVIIVVLLLVQVLATPPSFVRPRLRSTTIVYS